MLLGVIAFYSTPQTILRYVVLLSTVFCVTSCSPPRAQPVYYNVPFIQVPPDPPSHMDAITDKSPPEDVMKAWIATAVSERGWRRTVRKQIDAGNTR